MLLAVYPTHNMLLYFALSKNGIMFAIGAAYTAELLSVSLAQPDYPTRKIPCKYLSSIL